MDTELFMLVSLLVAGIVIAFYMDWLGLWVSKEEMRDEIERVQGRMRGPESQIADEAPATCAKAREEAGAEDRWRDDGGQGDVRHPAKVST